MIPIIFDGRKYADEKEASLAIRVLGLKTRGVYPKLASILIGNNPSGLAYLELKKKAAESIGAEADIYLIKENTNLDDLLLLIKTLNEDETVQGIMIQMPLPDSMKSEEPKILSAILPEKDVDGLRSDSDFLHPTSKAIIEVLHFAEKGLSLKTGSLKAVVVGATGMVGTPLVKELKKEGYGVIECNTKTKDLKSETLKGDVLISVTGKPGIITFDMIKKGAIVIDVGYPKGDIDMESFKGKDPKAISFLSPVPGGVGPVTITCLLENLINAS